MAFAAHLLDVRLPLTAEGYFRCAPCLTCARSFEIGNSNCNGRAIIERLLAGDEAAFTTLVTAHHASLLRLALTFVSDHGAAEEVVQDTWLGVLKGLKTFERRASLKTWIFRILVNRARTRGARDGRTVNFSALQDPEGNATNLIDRFSAEGRWAQPPSLWQEQDPEDLLLRAETADCLEHAIARLPASQRAVVTLRDVEGIEAQEVCNILEISETNQRVLLHRARTKVRVDVPAVTAVARRSRSDRGRRLAGQLV